MKWTARLTAGRLGLIDPCWGWGWWGWGGVLPLLLERVYRDCDRVISNAVAVSRAMFRKAVGQLVSLNARVRAHVRDAHRAVAACSS